MFYNELFSKLFGELRNYWLTNFPNQLIFKNNEETLGFKFLDDHDNPIIFFDIPFNHLSFYREFIFNPIEEIGLIPIVENDISLITNENDFIKIFSIIEKAYIIFIDYSTSKWKNYIINTSKSKNIILIVEENLDLKLDYLNFKKIKRPKEIDIYSSNIDKFINDLIEEIKPYSDVKDFQYEFEKLNADGHYEAAVVFAFKSLEIKLNEYAQASKKTPWFITFEKMRDYIPNLYSKILLDHRNIRNKIVHEDYKINKDQANTIIEDIKETLEIFDELIIKDKVPKIITHDLEKDDEQKKEKDFFIRNNIPENIKTIFYELKSEIKEIDKKIWLKVAKTAITFYDKRMFLYAVPQKRSLLITMPLDLKDSDMLVQRGSGKTWPGIKIEKVDQIKKVVPLIEKAYRSRGQPDE